MDTDKMTALVFSPLITLADMMESSDATAEECGEILALVMAGIEARAARATHAK